MSKRPRSLAFAVACAALVVACGGDDSDRRPFVVRSTFGSASGTMPIIVRGNVMVYFASEAMTGAAGEDLNGDTDMVDEIATFVRIGNYREQTIGDGVATRSVAIQGENVYLEVDEAEDDKDWDLDGTPDERVLLHWSDGDADPSFVATLSPAPCLVPMVVVGTRLYFVAAPTAALAGDETSVRYVEFHAPTQPVPVDNVTGAGTLDPILLGERAGLVFLAADESREAKILNADGDMGDPFVVALLDGTDSAATVTNTGLAVAGMDVPLAARVRAFGDWTAAFLVDEQDQGANLNNPTPDPIPVACAASDADMLDQVLFHLDYLAFSGGTSAAVNTGIAGRDRIVLIDGYVATLSDEAAATCDMNGDTDFVDTMVRWVETESTGALPPSTSVLLPVATQTPGGAMGFTELDGRFIAVIDEAQGNVDHDGKAAEHQLVAWLDPTDGAAANWKFKHQSASSPAVGTGVYEDIDGDGIGDPGASRSEPYAGTSWMSPEDTSGVNFARVALTFLEKVPGTNPRVPSLNNNLRCGLARKDTDLDDALPIWADFAGDTLDFDGMGYAVDAANAGIVVVGFSAFFRVSEMADSVDHNFDGDLNDVVLMRNPTAQCGPLFMSTASHHVGPVVFSQGSLGGALFADETQAGKDLNDDGDANDMYVVRYFHL